MDIAKLFRKNFSFLNKLLYKNNNQDQVITDQIVRLQNAIYNSKDWKILANTECLTYLMIIIPSCV